MSEDADEGDAAADAADEESDSEAGAEGPVGDFRDRLDDVAEAIETAETEAELDEVEADLDEIAGDLDAAELPEPDAGEDDAEEAEDADEGPTPREELEDRISELRDGIEDERGPYAEDVVDSISDARSTVSDTRWTVVGIDSVEDAVDSFLESANASLDSSVTLETDDDPAEQSVRSDACAATLEAVESAVEDAGLHADDDAALIAELLEATDTLESDLDDAEEWDDLETQEQLDAEGYYDVLGHYKDYPVEWSALKEHENRGNVDMVVLALTSLQSDFMEEHALEALERMGRVAATEEAIDEMLQRAGKRSQPAIRILGKMAATEAIETIEEYTESDSDPGLQKVTLKALGEIGSPAAVQSVATQLAADHDGVRSVAARSLGLIGDTRAIEPLAETLETDDNDTVRAAAAWGLRQIGTREALEIAAEYTDERSFLIQTEAEKATETLGPREQAA